MIRLISMIDLSIPGSTGLILIQSKGILITTSVNLEIPLLLAVHSDIGNDIRQTNEIRARITNSFIIQQDQTIYGIAIDRGLGAPVEAALYALDYNDKFITR